MTTSEELAILGGWELWLGFLHMLDTQKRPYVPWRIVLSCHCDAACQRAACLEDAGLATPTWGATGGWRVSSLQLPHMFFPGDNLNTDYESPHDFTTKTEVQLVACREIAAFLLLSGPQHVKLSQNAFIGGDKGVDFVRQKAQELQACYATRLSQAPKTTADSEPLWPTYKCVQLHNNAPRQPQRARAPTLFQPLQHGETQLDRDLVVIHLLQRNLLECEWHDTVKLPWTVWSSLTQLVEPCKLFALFKRHQYMFEIQIHLFRWERLRRDGERAAPAHGSSFKPHGASEARSAPSRPKLMVGEQPVGTWFAVRGVDKTCYGKSCSIDGDNQCLEIEWESKIRSTVDWTALCGFLPLPYEQELVVGEELCAWWNGHCHQVTYVSQEASTGLQRNWYDRNIIVRWCDEDTFVKCTHTWALA